MEKKSKRYIGVDLHTNSFTTCVRAAGKEEFATYALSEAGLSEFSNSLRKSDEVAVEATGNSAFFRDSVIAKVDRVVVVAPMQFQVIRKSVKKTDRHDAAALALFLEKDMLPEARNKDERYQRLHSLCTTRDQMVKLKSSLITKVHGILNRHGIKAKKESLTSKKGMQAALGHGFARAEQIELQVIAEQIESLKASIKKLEAAMADEAGNLPGYEGLKSIKGIGERSAAILLSVIGNIDDFANENKLAAYLGMVPKVAQSNDSLRTGRITKRGSKLGRTTLVQCTLIAIRYSPYLQNFYERIKARRGAPKAIIATAKKLLHIVFKTLKYNWIFEDFTTFTKQPQEHNTGSSFATARNISRAHELPSLG